MSIYISIIFEHGLSMFIQFCIYLHCIIISHGLQAESDIGPSMVLPSISEDDENQSDAEAKHTPSPSKSNSLIRSPLHSSPSPRHGKFLQR